MIAKIKTQRGGGLRFSLARQARQAPSPSRGRPGGSRSRLPLQERYKDHAGYVKAVTNTARALAKDRLLLADDVERYIDGTEASNVLR